MSGKAKGQGSAVTLRSSSGSTRVSSRGLLDSQHSPWERAGHQENRGGGTSFAQGQLFPTIWGWERGFFPSPSVNGACALKHGVCSSLLP